MNLTLLEQVRLCARAMGLEVREYSGNDDWHTIREVNGLAGDSYWPITNDIQVMALARRFMLEVNFFHGHVCIGYTAEFQYHTFNDESINHAIVECVAKIQQEKEKGNK